MSNGVVSSTTDQQASDSTSTTSSPGHRPLSLAELTGDLTDTDLVEVCRCGGCSVESLLQSVPCSSPTDLPHLSMPFMEWAEMEWAQGDVSQRLVLLVRLYLEYKALSNKFAKLKKDLCQWIIQKRLTFTNLSKILANLDSFMPSLPKDDKVSELKRAKTFNKLFGMLPDEQSFLDYQIYEDLTTEMKSAELGKKVKAYRELLDVYCQRRLIECPFFSLPGQVSLSNLVVELPAERSKMTLQELVLMREQLCGVLGVVANTFYPFNIRRGQTGNFQVVFRVPNYVKDVLPPLNVEQETAMRELGFVGWNFYNGPDMYYDPTLLANQLLTSDRLTEVPATNHHEASGGHPSNMQLTEVPHARAAAEMSSDDEDEDSLSRKKLQPAPGKKTRGRVKIPMEYIKNKLRRYTTFSKRKSNIMKKAYELSTLTGTQVMLMVASETGHVYTFATPKLQPMITSEAGKALIQTCLHQPEPLATPPEGNGDTQRRGRMSSSGYEETDLGGYLPVGSDPSKKGVIVPSSSLLPTSAMNHTMPAMFNPPPPSLPPSLTNELLPSSMLQSLVTSSAHTSLLHPPPLISPEGYSPSATDEERENGQASHSPTS